MVLSERTNKLAKYHLQTRLYELEGIGRVRTEEREEEEEDLFYYLLATPPPPELATYYTVNTMNDAPLIIIY